MKKKHKSSSTIWIKRQLKDPYVIKSQKEGYYSRAAYKLIEINNKFKILKPKDIIIDLGAAPGSWSQFATQIIKNDNSIIAIDLLPIKPITPKIVYIKSDIKNKNTYTKINNILGTKLVNNILSDVSCNLIGESYTDHLKNIELCYAAFELAKQFLLPKGNLVTKLMQGKEGPKFFQELKLYFEKIYYFKPQSSRKESREIYIVALNKI